MFEFSAPSPDVRAAELAYRRERLIGTPSRPGPARSRWSVHRRVRDGGRTY